MGLRWHKWENNCEEGFFGLPGKFFILESSLLRSNESEYEITLEKYFTLGTILDKSVVVEHPNVVNSLNAFIGSLKLNQSKVLRNVNYMQGTGRALSRSVYTVDLG